MEENQQDTSRQQQRILFEEEFCEWDLQYFGVGIRLSRKRPYGSILPSLSTYPVKQLFDHEWELIQTGSIRDIQQAFASKALHPFVQDEDGQNLLHIALTTRRLEVCHLLLSYGVQPSLPHDGDSIVLRVSYACNFLPTLQAIDMLRFVIGTLSQTLHTDVHWQREQKKFLWNQEIIKWLWQSGPEYHVDKAVLQEFCLRFALRRLNNQLPSQLNTARETLLYFLTPDLVARIQGNELTLLDDLFFPFEDLEKGDTTHCEQVAWDLGHLWLSTISQLGIDVPSYLAHELESHPGNLLVDPFFQSLPILGQASDLDRVIVCAHSEEKGYMVGWRYASEHTPGELLVQEFHYLVWREDHEWPFGAGKALEFDYCANQIPGSWVDSV